METIIENRADFSQSLFLLLTFNNLQDITIAELLFQPHQYQRVELTDTILFPPHCAVRIQLKMVDPGSDATNYQLLVTE